MIDLINRASLILGLRFFFYKNKEGGTRLQRRPSDAGALKKGYEKKSVACLVGLPKTGHTSISENLKNMSLEWREENPSPERMFAYCSDHHLFLSDEEKNHQHFHKSEFVKAKQTMKQHLRKYSLSHDDVLYFAFVRNPFDQVYSAWRESGERWGCGLSLEDYIEKAMDFYENEKKPKDGIEASQFWHIRPQYNNLLDEDNKVGVDFIFKFESIEKDFLKLVEVMKKHPIEDDSLLLHRNKKEDYLKRRNGGSLQFYTQKAKDLVKEFYKQDFLYFNY